MVAEAENRPTDVPGDRLAGPGAQRNAYAIMLGCSASVCFAALLASLAIGPTGVSLNAIPTAISAWWTGDDTTEALQARLVLFDLRLPRTLLAMFVGAALAVSGAMMQGLFRNPLADPGLIGVSAGAALAAIASRS